MSFDEAMIRDRLDRILHWVAELDELASLSRQEFSASRNAGAAESFLRRSLEAVFDVGRHMLAKLGRLDLAQEYKAIAQGMSATGIVDQKLGAVLVEMAGYRNRLVHFYHEVSVDELYEIVRDHRSDLLAFVRQVAAYLESHLKG